MLQFEHNERKLIAAKASYGVRFTQASGEPSCSLREQAVTSSVPESVVDVFEMIQIQDQKRSGPLGAARVRDSLPEAVAE
jgi:hypothetical protein